MTRTIRTYRPRLKSISSIILKPSVCLLLLLFLAACRSKQETVIYKGQDMRQLVRAGMRLGIEIEEDDNWPLMIVAADWIGTPYVFGGNTKQGVDCSGLSKALYRDVYGKNLHRRSIQQYQEDSRKVSKRSLREGDLVFFAPGGDKNKVNHVGVYLRDGKFVHASSSKGVIVSNLGENYFQRNWVGGGRVRL